MSVEVKYEVIRQFKYGGKLLKPGDEFEPGGGKWDHVLIADDGKFVKRVEIKPITRRRTGAKAKVTDG